MRASTRDSSLAFAGKDLAAQIFLGGQPLQIPGSASRPCLRYSWKHDSRPVGHPKEGQYERRATESLRRSGNRQKAARRATALVLRERLDPPQAQDAGWKGSLTVANAIGHLPDAAWRHPALTASYGFVIVKPVTRSSQGASERDFGPWRAQDRSAHPTAARRGIRRHPGRRAADPVCTTRTNDWTTRSKWRGIWASHTARGTGRRVFARCVLLAALGITRLQRITVAWPFLLTRFYFIFLRF